MPRQADLAATAKMQQSRISMFETPGAANLTLDTLSRLAAAFKVGLVIKFVPFSEMLRWENDYSQDVFDVTRIDHDIEFINPNVGSTRNDIVAMSPIPARAVNGSQMAAFSLDGVFQGPITQSQPLVASGGQVNGRNQAARVSATNNL
jgi:transcriptional regulator with XRE-family HTH domain